MPTGWTNQNNTGYTGFLPNAKIDQGGGSTNTVMSNGFPMPYWFTAGSKNTPYPGVSALFNLLQNPGQTDSNILNRNLLANTRGTQASQTAAAGRGAMSGFGANSPGFSALQAAIGQAGQNREASIYQDEARRREDLLRSDLMDLLGGLIIGPEVQTYGANKGVSVGQMQAKAQKQGAAFGGLGTLIGLIGAAAASSCATAEELYGVDSEDTAMARLYMGTMAEPETRRAYGTGRELAARVKADPELRAKVQPIFDGFVREARAVFGRK